MRRRSSRGSASRDAHAVERHAAGGHDRRSAAAGGRSCSCPRPTARRSRPSRPAAPKRHAVEHGRLRPRRIGEAHALERDLAARRLGQRHRLRRRLDLRLDRQQLDQPLGRAGGLRQLAPDFAQLPEPARREHRIEDELPERARRGAPGEHVLRADPEHDHDAAEHQEDDDRGQQRARARSSRRAASKARSTAAAKRDCASRLVGEGLQGADRADQLGRIGRGVGERVLRGARAPPHQPPERRPAAARSPGSPG